MTYISTGYSASGICAAHIAISRNRVKEYSGNTVYLKDGSNFEIELHNSKQVSVLAKIYINGQLISNRGIVLRPGERVFLERYIDQNKKFLFSTYEVEDTKESKNAIQKNGEVKVEFYDEYVPHQTNTWITSTSTGYLYNPSTFTLGNSGTFNIGNATYSSSATRSAPSFACFTSDMLSEDSSKSIETGRVEAGGSSNQGLNEVNGNYNSFASSWTTIKILPGSTKPVEVSQIRNYCSSCGTRIRKPSWAFCPTCGTKFE